jgi:acyl-CoA thioesterase I
MYNPMVTAIVGAWAHMQGIADKSTYLDGITRLMAMEWPNNRTVNIVCHGHSVPAGYFKTPVVDTFNSYPYLLHATLKKRHANAVINIIVTAVGGENSLRGSDRFDSEVLCHHPDLITIDYSLNDRPLGLEKAQAAWSSMIQRSIAAGSKVILLTPTPDSHSDSFSPDDPLNQHANQVRQLAETFHVGLADSLKAFMDCIGKGTDLGVLMSHFNHPNRAGHELVAAELLKWFP